MPDQERAFGGAHEEAQEAAGRADEAGARVKRVRKRPIDDYDRAGRQIAEVLRSADRTAEATRELTEKWVQERHAIVDREVAQKHDEATELEARAKRALADAEQRLSEAEARAREAVELQERARRMEAEQHERAAADRREVERVLSEAKARGAEIVAGAEREAGELLRGVLAEQQQRIERLRAEEERTGARIEALLGAMPPADQDTGPVSAGASGEGPEIDPRPAPAAEETARADDDHRVGHEDAAVAPLLVPTSGGEAGSGGDENEARRLARSLEEVAVADIVQSAIRRATGQPGDEDESESSPAATSRE